MVRGRLSWRGRGRVVARASSVVAALAAFCPPAPGAAQTSAFVARLGRDTVAVERFTRRGALVRGVNVIRSPRTLVRRYELRLLPDGSPASLRLESSPPGGPVLETTEWLWKGDSVIGSLRRDTVQRRWRVAVAGRPLPFFETLYGPWDAALRRVGAGNSLPLVYVRQVLPYTLQRHPDRSATLHLPGHDPEFDDVVVRADRTGALELVDMTATTTRYVARRVPTLDVEALAAEFARRENAGKGLGVLSPRDTVRAEIGGAHLLLDYSRPAVRGRSVFGGLLAPFGYVWRTGADAATQLSTDRALELGGQRVPPGTYSVFSIPSAGGWTLILNRQHGQWGTEYHAEQDLARIPLQLKRLGAPVERFTARVERAAEGGVLRLSWADREGSVAFRVR